MAALDQLFTDPPELANCLYLPLTDVVPKVGPMGRFLKLICIDDDGIPLEAIADHRHFHLVDPYFQELRRCRENADLDWPVIPIYQSAGKTWRFSWRTALRDHPELQALEPPAPPENDLAIECAYRMQVSIPGTLAQRFKAAAASRGMRHTELLLALIRDAAT